jgi:hypothetical protein
MPAEPITAQDVTVAARAVYDRLEREAGGDARSVLLGDLAEFLELMGRTGPPEPGPFLDGYAMALYDVRAWMVDQSVTGDLDAGNETT